MPYLQIHRSIVTRRNPSRVLKLLTIESFLKNKPIAQIVTMIGLFKVHDRPRTSTLHYCTQLVAVELSGQGLVFAFHLFHYSEVFPMNMAAGRRGR